jgi:hypothetical protein
MSFIYESIISLSVNIRTTSTKQFGYATEFALFQTSCKI